MKEVVWKQNRRRGSATTKVGGVSMYCSVYYLSSSRCGWYAAVYIRGDEMRYGRKRKKISDAKADCIRIANEMLLDHKVCLDMELANFGLME